jgi:hypothetical protein
VLEPSPRFAVRPVADGDGLPVVTVDFQPFSQDTTLSSQLADRGSPRPIHGVDAVADLVAAPAVVEVATMALAYASDLRRVLSGDDITVVGFCSGASLAAFIAAELSTDSVVHLHLVQPTWPTEEMAAREFARFRRDMGAQDAYLGGFQLTSMAEVLRSDLDAALGRMRVVNASVRSMYESLLSRYLAWLAFLLAGSTAPMHRLPTDQLVHVVLAEEDDPDVFPAGWTPKSEVDRYAVGSDELVAHTPFLDALLSWKGEA